jgi:hypothetical protein
MLADSYLVAILKRFARNAHTVHVRSVPRAEIRDHIAGRTCLFVQNGIDACVLTRDLCIVDTNVRFKGAAEDDLFAFKRDRDGYEVTCQENKRWPKVSGVTGGFLHRGQDG